jgi:hypothetical protein
VTQPQTLSAPQKTLSPTHDLILDKCIENLNRKLVAGFRNRDLNKPIIKSTIEGASTKASIEVGNRGKAWNDIITKSFTSGIRSLTTLKFDNVYEVTNGVLDDSKEVSSKPGVYVIYDASGNIKYIGDSENISSRLNQHLSETRSVDKSGTQYKLGNDILNGEATIKVIDCISSQIRC